MAKGNRPRSTDFGARNTPGYNFFVPHMDTAYNNHLSNKIGGAISSVQNDFDKPSGYQYGAKDSRYLGTMAAIKLAKDTSAFDYVRDVYEVNPRDLNADSFKPKGLSKKASTDFDNAFASTLSEINKRAGLKRNKHGYLV